MARLVERLQSTPALKSLLAADPLTPLHEMSDDDICPISASVARSSICAKLSHGP